MGGMDIYVTKKDSAGEWGEPLNLGYPINTENDENSLTVSADGRLGYFASDREGGLGGLDLYTFELPEHARPERVTYMKGRVYDVDTKVPLSARFELIDLETKEVVAESFSDKESGEFLICVPANHDYALNVSKSKYLFFSEGFQLKESPDKLEPFMKDVPLIPIKVGVSVVLKNVFFDTDKYDLKPRSIAELSKLVEFLNKNESIKIEISGHTDSQGDAGSNKTLSNNRAIAVKDFLVNNGIVTIRLSAAGYGEEKPVATNDTEEGRAENRRTEFKVVGM